MLFMADESIKFNNGQGDQDIVTYLGPMEHEHGLKHKIINSSSKEFLVDGVMLLPLEEPDIASVPATIEHYASELPNLTKDQLEQIAHPEILDNDQRELMALHCKMNHVPFPTLIRMAQIERINKKFALLKDRVPVCMSCVFGMAHRRPWRSKGAPKSIRKDSKTAPGECISID